MRALRMRHAAVWSWLLLLLLAVPTEARAAAPDDLIFADGFDPCDPDLGVHATEATALDLGSITDCDSDVL